MRPIIHLPVLAFAIAITSCDQHPGRDIAGHARISTEMELRQLEDAIESYTAYARTLPCRVIPGNSNVDSAELTHALVNGKIVFLKWPRSEADDRLLDRWKQEVRVTVTALPGNTNTFGFKLWSTGPDGVDNSGGGDDICREVTVVVPAQQSP
jgi:hypothetical protein